MGTAASKLLYTLHWTLLDAAEECADADREAGIAPREPFPYIFPLTCIQVFCFFFFFFIFTPIVRSNLLVSNFPGIRLPLCSVTSLIERSRFTKLPAGKWAQDLAGTVGLQASQRSMFHGTRQT